MVLLRINVFIWEVHEKSINVNSIIAIKQRSSYFIVKMYANGFNQQALYVTHKVNQIGKFDAECFITIKC